MEHDDKNSVEVMACILDKNSLFKVQNDTGEIVYKINDDIFVSLEPKIERKFSFHMAL